jgi:hypothetical protein
MIDPDWWDQLQVNFYQAPDGFIAIHAFKKFKGCAYFEVPEEWIENNNFFERVYEKSVEMWNNMPVVTTRPCPVCNRTVSSFRFRYKGKYFCLNCGSHYELSKGFVKITRSILETK